MAKRLTKRSSTSKRRNLALSTLPGVGSVLKHAGDAVQRFVLRNGNPAKFDRCVKAVKKRGGANPYAVCTAAGTRGNGKVERFVVNFGNRKNPEDAAAARYEIFHGRQPSKEFTFKTNVHRHKVLSGIGKLKELEIFSITGDRTVKLEHFKGALLAQDEKGKQLYIVGGDQGVSLESFGIKNPHEHEI